MAPYVADVHLACSQVMIVDPAWRVSKLDAFVVSLVEPEAVLDLRVHSDSEVLTQVKKGKYVCQSAWVKPHISGIGSAAASFVEGCVPCCAVNGDSLGAWGDVAEQIAVADHVHCRATVNREPCLGEVWSTIKEAVVSSIQIVHLVGCSWDYIVSVHIIHSCWVDVAGREQISRDGVVGIFGVRMVSVCG